MVKVSSMVFSSNQLNVTKKGSKFFCHIDIEKFWQVFLWVTQVSFFVHIHFQIFIIIKLIYYTFAAIWETWIKCWLFWKHFIQLWFSVASLHLAVLNTILFHTYSLLDSWHCKGIKLAKQSFHQFNAFKDNG